MPGKQSTSFLFRDSASEQHGPQGDAIPRNALELSALDPPGGAVHALTEQFGRLPSCHSQGIQASYIPMQIEQCPHTLLCCPRVIQVLFEYFQQVIRGLRFLKLADLHVHDGSFVGRLDERLDVLPELFVFFFVRLHLLSSLAFMLRCALIRRCWQ